MDKGFFGDFTPWQGKDGAYYNSYHDMLAANTRYDQMERLIEEQRISNEYKKMKFEEQLKQSNPKLYYEQKTTDAALNEFNNWIADEERRRFGKSYCIFLVILLPISVLLYTFLFSTPLEYFIFVDYIFLGFMHLFFSLVVAAYIH